jgi:hypothetical protein
MFLYDNHRRCQYRTELRRLLSTETAFLGRGGVDWMHGPGKRLEAVKLMIS